MDNDDGKEHFNLKVRIVITCVTVIVEKQMLIV